ncbi:hypothetical protein ACFX11_040082 [Malus domestica]
MCVGSRSKREKENALDQSEDVKYSDVAKQDELMETYLYSKQAPTAHGSNAKTLRGWIEEQNKRVVQCKGFALAKNKERDLQAKSLEEMAKRTTADNGSDGICEAVRIQPYLVDADGHCFWKLKGDFGEDILLQDLGTWDGTPSGEQRSVCSAIEPIDKYGSSPTLKEKQAKRERRHSKNLQLSQTSSESNNENAQVSQTPDSNGKKGQVSQAPECNRENMELGPEVN